MDDPLSIVYDKLWEMALAFPKISTLVKPANRIRFDQDGKPDPLKDSIQDGDLPELQLIAETMNGNVQSDSSSSRVVMRYSFIVSTGDYRIHKKVLPITWALLRALCTWKNTLTQCQWNDKRFVIDAKLLQSQLGDSVPERNRGIRGWSALWSCEVHMNFTTADLVNTSIE